MNYRVELQLAASALTKARVRRDFWIATAAKNSDLTRKEIAEIVGLVESRINQIARGE